MEILNNKNLIKKIVIAIAIVLLFNFIAPTCTMATGMGDKADESVLGEVLDNIGNWGMSQLDSASGLLLEPIVYLISWIGDSALTILSTFFYDNNGILGNVVSVASIHWPVLLFQIIGPGTFDMVSVPKIDKETGEPIYDKVIDANETFYAIPKMDWGDSALIEALQGTYTIAEKLTALKSIGKLATLSENSYTIPTTQYSVEKIFANQIPAFDVNFINPKDWGDKGMNELSITRALQGTISSWYNALRNLVLVLLLSVLLYVGIRMMITSVASDKAKYKQMLMDWLVAMCLLFFLHYIMSFTMTFIEVISEGIGESVTSIDVKIIDPSLYNDQVTFKTNLMGYCKLMMQHKNFTTSTIFLIFYIALIVYTFKFTWQYMKRTFKMAFLTLMAPIVTLTYPIDKMGDGKSQAFNMWLKEYIFTALLQPFHLIIYSIFLGGSMEIAVNNPLFAIFFLAFMSPAEKMLRKFFKFDQSSDAGGSSFAGGFGGAAAFNAIKNVVNGGVKLANTAMNLAGQGGGIPQIGGGSSGPDVRTANTNYDAFTNNASNSVDVADNAPTADDVTQASSDIGGADKNKYNNRAGDYLESLKRSGEEMKIARKYVDNPEAIKDLETKMEANKIAQEVARSKIDNRQKEEQEKYNRKVAEGQKTVREMANNRIATQRKQPDAKAGRRAIAKYLGKGALKLGGKALAAGAMGVVGLGVGITGDDLDDVLKYGGLGAGLGYTAVPKLAKNAYSGALAVKSDLENVYEIGAYGEEEATLREKDRQFVKNNKEELAQLAEAQVGHIPTASEIDEVTQVATEYNRAGISDVDQIRQAMEMEQELRSQINGTNLSEQEITKQARAQAETIVKLANEIRDRNVLRNKKWLEEYQISTQEKLENGGLEKDVAEKVSKNIVKQIKKLKNL